MPRPILWMTATSFCPLKEQGVCQIPENNGYRAEIVIDLSVEALMDGREDARYV